jgi:hypothetical protein
MARPRHQNGWLTEHGNQIYGNFWRYVVDPATGERKKRQACVPLGKIGELKKWKAREQLKGIIAEELGPRQTQERPDPQTTFEWFVEHRYLPMREGRWHQATKDKTTYEIKRYLVEYFGERALEEINQFELQVHLNKLAKDFSDSIVRHTFSNVKAIFREVVRGRSFYRLRHGVRRNALRGQGENGGQSCPHPHSGPHSAVH